MLYAAEAAPVSQRGHDVDICRVGVKAFESGRRLPKEDRSGCEGVRGEGCFHCLAELRLKSTDSMFAGIPDEIESQVAILEEPDTKLQPDNGKPQSVPLRSCRSTAGCYQQTNDNGKGRRPWPDSVPCCW